ncbi:MAG: hypothetical protein ACRCYP_05255 [Alphaproteobacteria bacterium]
MKTIIICLALGLLSGCSVNVVVIKGSDVGIANEKAASRAPSIWDNYQYAEALRRESGAVISGKERQFVK